jgi:hypothetical protein
VIRNGSPASSESVALNFDVHGSGHHRRLTQGHDPDTDVQLTGSVAALPPKDVIGPNHGYYFICIGYEILAELAGAGLVDDLDPTDDHSNVVAYSEARLKDLAKIMDEWKDRVDLDSLSFLADPWSQGQQAENRRN